MTTPGIRFMADADRTEVSAILWGCPEVPWSAADVARLCRGPSTIGRVAVEAGRVVGLIVYRNVTGGYEVLLLAVHPEYRRKGIGRALVGVLVDRLVTSTRRTRIILECDEWNDGAIAFYRALGFRATCLVRDGVSPGRDSIRFRFALPPTADLREPAEWCDTSREEKWQC